MYSDKEILNKYRQLINLYNISGYSIFVSLERFIFNRYNEKPTQLMNEVWQYCQNDY